MALETSIFWNYPLIRVVKDTVTTDEENNIVETNDDSNRTDTSVGLNAIIHDFIPVFTSQDLKQRLERHQEDCQLFKKKCRGLS